MHDRDDSQVKTIQHQRNTKTSPGMIDAGGCEGKGGDKEQVDQVTVDQALIVRSEQPAQPQMLNPGPPDIIKAQHKYQKSEDRRLEKPVEIYTCKIIRNVRPLDIEDHQRDRNGEQRIAEHDHPFKFELFFRFHTIISDKTRN